MADEWDIRLHERLLAAEGEALADAYDLHAPAVFGVAIRIIGDSAAAEEIVQNVFLGLWEHPGHYDPGRGRMRAWLCAAARYRAIDERRRVEVRGRHLPGGLGPVTVLAPVAEEPAGQDPMTKAVRAAMVDLAESQRAVVMLAYYGGFTYAEVAETCGIDAGTAKSRLRAAVRALADRLAAEGLLDG